MSIKDLIIYITDCYIYLFSNTETVIGTIAYIVPFILAIKLNNNKLLWLLLLSPALNGAAVYVYHWLYLI